MRRFINAWTEFMNNQLGHFTRTQGSMKKRKYAHIQIQEDFKRLELERKRERFRLLSFRKKLINDRLKLKRSLLESSKPEQSAQSAPSDQKSLPQMEQEVKELSTNLAELEHELKQFDSQLSDVDKELESTESEHILLMGIRRQIIDNHITHIRHITQHGLTLHPETQKVVENVHYLLEHNLPIPKHQLYEIMPEMFKREIGEMDEAARKLLEEKKLVFQEKSERLVGYYERKKLEQHEKAQKMVEEVDDMWYNINIKTQRLLEKHIPTIDAIYEGKTRFRSAKHFYFECIDVDDEKQFTPEQWALKQDILEVVKWKDEYKEFEALTTEAVDKELFRLRIPLFVLNNPKLEAFWRKRHAEIVEKRVRITEVPHFLPQVEFRNELEIRVREALEKEMPAHFKLGNTSDRTNKDEAYHFVLNIFTRVMNELPQDPEDSILDMSPKQQEKFFKLTPQMKKQMQEQQQQLGQKPLPRTENRLTLDHLTKMLDLNNKDPSTYTLEFFSRYFGVDPKLLHNTFNYLSYPKVSKIDEEQKIIRFIMNS